MLTPLYIAALIRAELLRARSMAAALARNLGHVLDNADRVVPFALVRLDDLLADDVIRLLACLKGAHALHDRLGANLAIELALGQQGASESPAMPTPNSATPGVGATA